MNNRSSEQPNIVFILADQLKPEATSAYGNSVVKTPNIEGMAQEGVVFNRCFANSALCGPCRHSIYTGTYPFAEPEWAQPNCASLKGVRYMGEHLSHAGYQTASLGRLHGMPENSEFGFEICQHSWESADFPFNHYRNWVCEKLAHYKNGEEILQRWQRHRDVYPGRVLDDPTFFPRELSAEAWLDEQAREFLDTRSDDRPFFLHLGVLHPHLPWLTLRTEDEQYDPASLPVPENIGIDNVDLSQRPVLKSLREKWFKRKVQNVGDFTEDEWKVYAANYYGAVGQVDKLVGNVLKMLRDRGLDENTIVVLSSDHSEQLGVFGFDQKETLYEGSLHIPLIFWGAGIPSGQRRETLCEQIDLVPTFLDFAGVSADPVMEGISVKPAIDNADIKIKEATYAWLSYAGAVQAMIRTDRYKLYRAGHRGDASGEVFELFDLQSDPLEMKNLYGQIDNPEIRRLKEDFHRFFWNHAGEVGCSQALCKELDLRHCPMLATAQQKQSDQSCAKDTDDTKRTPQAMLLQ